MAISEQLAAKIADLIEKYERGGPPSDPVKLRQLVAREKVLPLSWDMGGVLAINARGDILSFTWDDVSRPTVEHDTHVRNVALLQGSVKYPELKDLRPAKPDDARLCSYCGGAGVAPHAVKGSESNVVCYCGGLGWIP